MNILHRSDSPRPPAPAPVDEEEEDDKKTQLDSRGPHTKTNPHTTISETIHNKSFTDADDDDDDHKLHAQPHHFLSPTLPMISLY